MNRYKKIIVLAVVSGIAASLLVAAAWLFARVNAATFDSNVVPSSTATYNLGVSGQIWSSVNGILYFSGSNVGIGVSSPSSTLEVNGGVRLNTATSQPTCSSTSTRGTFWVVENGAGVKDSVAVCAKDASDAYAWRTIY